MLTHNIVLEAAQRIHITLLALHPALQAELQLQCLAH